MSDFRTDNLSCEGCPLAEISFADCRHTNEGYGDCKEVIMWLDEYDKRIRDDAIEEFKQALKQELNKYDFWIYDIADSDGYTLETSCNRDYLIDEVAEQLKEYK